MCLYNMRNDVQIYVALCSDISRQQNTTIPSENNTIEKKEIIHFELDGGLGRRILTYLRGVFNVDHHLEIIT